jgi:hypothetical protein
MLWRKKILDPTGTSPTPSVIQLVAIRYSDYAILVPTGHCIVRKLPTELSMDFLHEECFTKLLCMNNICSALHFTTLNCFIYISRTTNHDKQAASSTE